LEKLERRDPLKKFSERVVMQKTIQGREVTASPSSRAKRNSNV